jgi:hypothetical protein
MVRVLPKNDGPSPVIYVCAAEGDRSIARFVCQWLDAAGMPSWSRVTKISGPSEGADTIIPKAKVFLLVATPDARTAPLVLFDLRRAFLSGTPIVALAVGPDGLEVAQRINHPCAGVVPALLLEESVLEEVAMAALLTSLRQAMKLSLKQRIALLYARLLPSDAALQEPFRFDPWPTKPKKGEPGYKPFSPLLLVSLGAVLLTFTIIGLWVFKPFAALERIKNADSSTRTASSTPASAPPPTQLRPVDPKQAANLAAAQQLQIRLVELSPVFVKDGKNNRTLKLIVSNPGNETLSVPPIAFLLFANNVEVHRQKIDITRPILGPGEDMELTQDIIGLPDVDGQAEINFEALL